MNLYEDKFRFLNYNLKKYNWRLLLLVIIATVLGLFVLESAADGYARKQLLGMVVGLIGLVVVSFIDYNFILKFQWPIYLMAVVMLAAVLVFGVNVNGAKPMVLTRLFRDIPAKRVCQDHDDHRFNLPDHVS